MRTRSAVVAMLVVAVSFGAAAVALIVLLQQSLQRTADAASETRAAQVTSELAAATDPTTLDPALFALTGQISVVEVIDAAGQPVKASERAPAQTLLTSAQAGKGAFVVTVREAEETTDFRAVAQQAGDYLVVVASEQEPITDAVSVVELLLAVALPALVLVVGVATHLLVGRSLRPVERMRSQAAEISTAELSERLPLPGSRDEIGRLASTLNEMLDRLENGHLAQRRFVGDASHELRGPLATLSAALELGSSKPELLDENLIRSALLPEARRMQGLVEDLLLLAKADEHGVPLRITDVDLDDLLSVEHLRLRTLEGLEVWVRARPVQIRGDRDQLARLLRNLVDNGVRHAASRLDLTCAHGDGEVIVRVSDDGPGVPPEDRTKVFERFVRLDTGRARSAGGSGLGLAIAAEIAHAHAGSIVVGESKWGGACFEVRLPSSGSATASGAIRAP